MKLEEILELWREDVEIDPTELGNESISIPKLHHKYYQIYVHEKLTLISFEHAHKQLKLEKYEFYTQGHTDETRAKGWKLPAKGMLLKSDTQVYMDGDTDLINSALKIGLQQEKVSLLESIIKTLNNRNFLIRAAIDDNKFKSGG